MFRDMFNKWEGVRGSLDQHLLVARSCDCMTAHLQHFCKIAAIYRTAHPIVRHGRFQRRPGSTSPWVPAGQSSKLADVYVGTSPCLRVVECVCDLNVTHSASTSGVHVVGQPTPISNTGSSTMTTTVVQINMMVHAWPLYELLTAKPVDVGVVPSGVVRHTTSWLKPEDL